MQFGNDRQTMSQADARVSQYDVGLRKFMFGVYNYMASAVALTGIIAMLVASSPAALQMVHGTPLKWVLFAVPLLIGLFGIGMAPRISVGAVQAMFWVYAASFGALLSYIFVLFDLGMVARAFFITAITFGALSLYGYTTKRDLSPMGKFLFFGMIGILLAVVANFFFESSLFSLVIDVAVVLVFGALTAYETQNLKDTYNELDARDVATKKTIIGALVLYASFMAMFQAILHLLNVFQGE